MKAYVMHYTKLKKRKNFILNQLNKIEINDIEIIEDYDKDNLTPEIINKYYSTDEKEFNKVAKITKDKCGGGQYRILKDSEISLMLKHIEALKRLSESDNEYALILEDDCAFYDYVNKKTLIDIVESCPSNWNVIVIGGAFDHSICSYESRIDNFLLAKHPATNTTSSMIFKKDTALNILNTFKKFHLSWDWQLNYIFYKNRFNIYHTIPYMCRQNNFYTSIQV